MRRASLTYTRRYFRMSLAATLLVLAGPLAGADGHDERLERLTGAGTWGTDNATAGAANATWLVIGRTVQAFHVEQAGTRFHCLVLPADANATCTARHVANATYAFEHIGRNATWRGAFEAATRIVLVDAGRDGTPSPWPGFIVATLAATFLVATIVLAVLFLQERRVARYLVRRLYEETKGRLPPDWPENLRQQWIARIFIRGKN